MKDILEKSNLMLLEKNNITRTHIDDYLESEGIHPQLFGGRDVLTGQAAKFHIQPPSRQSYLLSMNTG